VDGFRRAFRLDRRSQADARTSVDEELEFHLREAEEELVEAGWTRDEARREVLRRFGDLEATRAFCRDVQTRRGREERKTMSMDDLLYDVRHALRSMLKAPGYATLVVVTLAFGVAANTTIFSAMRPYLLRALPYGSPSELVQVNQVNPVTGWDMDRFSYPQVLDWKERTRAFEEIGAYSYGGGNLAGAEGPEQVQFGRVTANLFGGVLRVEPVLGRGFRPEEARPGGDPVALLSDALWRRRYAADPGILGRAISLDGIQRTVVGVMPPSFVFPFGSARLWLPVSEDATADRGRMNLQIVGRLNAGWTAERARAELAGIQSELATRYPDADGHMSGVTVKPLREALNFAWDVLSISFRILLGAVAFVLLIACLNVASLTLARGGGRAREVAVRAALGAPRRRIVRQLLTESLVLALVGGALGVLLTYWVTSLIDPVLPEELYRVGHIEVDGAVLTFSLLVTLATPLVFGLWPALSASRVGIGEDLKESSKSSGGVARSRARSALVVAQVGLAVVLITGATLMLRSLASVQNIDLGFDAGRIVTAEVTLPTAEYPTPEERVAWVGRAVAELQGTPGVASASAAAWLPLNHEMYTWQVAPPEMAGVPTEEWPLVVLNEATPGYFETMGVALLEGRDFSDADGPDGEQVVVVSRSLARRLWPDRSAIGRTLLAEDDPGSPARFRVVGVVGDVRHADLSMDGPGLELYRPVSQEAGRRYFLLARTEASPAQLVAPVREALLAADADLPANVRPMSDVVRENLLQWGIGSVFMGAFGGGALLLSMLGIYGLIAYSVAQRRREIGVRLAIGATPGEIRRVLVRDGVRLALFGVAIGLVLAVLLARVASSALYGVSPFDPFTLVAVPVLFLGVAVAAALVPAQRASRTDPIQVMRAE
jgi:putative ABC transport system permease protein